MEGTPFKLVLCLRTTHSLRGRTCGLCAPLMTCTGKCVSNFCVFESLLDRTRSLFYGLCHVVGYKRSGRGSVAMKTALL